jgi:lysozyme
MRVGFMKKSWVYPLLALFLVAPVQAANLQAEVVDSQGQPLANAVVSLRNEAIAPPAPAPARASKFTRLVQAVGKRYGPGAAARLAVSAGLLAVPGPGWIMALINLGFNASLAWGIYQIWKEISGSAEDTSEDTITENATPIAGMSAATNELTQSLAQLTGTDTESGTIPALTNSFDELVSTTDMLIEAFGSLKTSINSNNIATASTTSRPTDTGTSNVANIQPTTSRSFDSGTSSANMQTASIQSSTPRSFDSGTNVSEQETKDFIIGNEGIRYEPYEDTLGNWTVGVGHLIGKDLPSNMNRRFSHQEIMDLFDNDFIHHKTAAERIPGFDKMDGLGQTALTDLTFNMGPSWINSWPNLTNQLGEGDIPSATDNLRNSRWYDQVGNRGPRVTNMLEDSTMISAAQGGIASGPETGYLGKLHGTELIQPINSDSVLSKLATTPESSVNSITDSNEIQTKMSEMYRSNMMLVNTLNSKLDAMISRLDDGNYIQERILSNTV